VLDFTGTVCICIFHPISIVLHFSVLALSVFAHLYLLFPYLHFPSLHSGTWFSILDYSTPRYLIFPYLHFHTPRFRLPHCCMTPPFQGTPTNIRINLILSESRVIGLHRRHSLYSLSSFKFSWWAPKDARILKQERNGPSRSSKVVDFGTNRKHVCHFLFVVNSNLGPILPRFRDIAGFLLKTAPHPYSTRILGVFPLN